MRVYLGLGSNLGNRLRNLQSGLDLLAPHVTVIRVASLYQSPASGQPGQQPYWNSAAEVETNVALSDLLGPIKRAEFAMGRRPGLRWDSRPLDIDILLAGVSVETPALVVPHPLLAERSFALWPLAEIAPDVLHPGLRRSIAELRAERAAGGLARVAGPEWRVAMYLREPADTGRLSG